MAPRATLGPAVPPTLSLPTRGREAQVVAVAPPFPLWEGMGEGLLPVAGGRFARH